MNQRKNTNLVRTLQKSKHSKKKNNPRHADRKCGRLCQICKTTLQVQFRAICSEIFLANQKMVTIIIAVVQEQNLSF